jgi:hypothetical protein
VHRSDAEAGYPFLKKISNPFSLALALELLSLSIALHVGDTLAGQYAERKSPSR